MIEKELAKKAIIRDEKWKIVKWAPQNTNKNWTAWRPPKITESVVNKLEEGFAMGFTDSEACLYADISRQTFYDYLKKNPEFADRKEHLKDQPKMKAKINIVKSIQKGDVTDSKWYAERKSKDEFSLKEITEVQGEMDVNVNIKI